MEKHIDDGFDPNHCRDDGGTGLYTLVWSCRGNSNRDEAADKRILRVLLEVVELLRFDESGETVLDSLLRIEFENQFWLVRVFLENFPEYKVLERSKMILVIFEKAGLETRMIV